MLATWLRARQTPGACARTPCVSSRGMPAGRGMKAHWRNKRAPTSLSPMVFTAALTSGTEDKIAAQKSWDRALEQLREAMRHQNGQEPSAIEAATGSAEDMMQSRIDWAAVQRLAAMELVDDQASYDNEVLMLNEPFGLNGVVVTPKHHDVLAKHTLETAPAGWVANTGPDLVSKNLPPQSLWALPTMREAAMRRRHTWKKLALQRLSAALMICTFLRHANLPRFAESHPERMAEVIPHLRNVAFMTEAQVQVLRTKLLRKMEMLHQMPVDSTDNAIHTAMQGLDQPEVPHYLHDADGEFHDIAQRLNESISKQILQGKRTDDDGVLAFALAKICHNLFVSTAPPNLATFNMLLSGFRTWERPHLVDQTIAALYAHKIRPNEVTCVEILTHYVLQSQPDEFSSFVAKMRGADDALMLANPDITINEASSGRLIRLDEQKVLQKVHPAPMVFGALLKGVLHFAGFDRALDVYYEMKADGWGLDIAGLVMLLRRCIPKADWEGGLYLWEEINSIKMRCSAVDMVPAYYHMLSLCSITGNTTAFNQILNEVARRGMDRKDIIDKATDLTRKARNSGPNLAPAFTADNVLIAVSNYLDDVQSDAKKSVDKGNGDMMSSALVYEDEQLDLEKHDPNDDETRSVTREEAWSSWIEHEVGERPKDPKL